MILEPIPERSVLVPESLLAAVVDPTRERAFLVFESHAPAFATVARVGLDELRRRDGVRVPLDFLRAMEGLEAFAASCQARRPTRDNSGGAVEGGPHANSARPTS